MSVKMRERARANARRRAASGVCSAKNDTLLVGFLRALEKHFDGCETIIKRALQATENVGGSNCKRRRVARAKSSSVWRWREALF